MAQPFWQTLVPELKAGFSQPNSFKNLVVGAGPAGLAVTSTLLDGDSSPTLWVDPEFQSGRLQQYLEVPSNTKVRLFTQYAKATSAVDSSWATEQFQVSRCPQAGVESCCYLAAQCKQAFRYTRARIQNEGATYALLRKW